MKLSLSIFATLVFMSTAATAQMVSSHAPTLAKIAPQAKMEGSSTLLQATGKPVAKVNGTILTDRDLVHEMFVIFPYGQLHNGIPKSMEPEMRRGAMDMIIFDELVYQEALRRKMIIPEDKLKIARERVMKQFPDKRAYDQFLATECQNSPQVFQRKLTRTLLIEALVKQEVSSKAKLSEQELRNYYNQNPAKFTQADSFSIQSISIIPPTGSPENQKEARKRADIALKAARASKSYQEFGLLAEKYSDDDFHVDMGDHKAVERSKMPPELVKVALAMKPGDVSDLIQLGPNYTIFRLNAHIPAGRVSFQEIKGKLAADLQKAKYDHLRGELNKQLRKTAKVQEL